MGNIFTICLLPILHATMKLAGVRPQTVEIELGTVMNFWIPTTQTSSKKSKPAVVFLHGFEADGITTWPFQVLSFVGDYAVYIPDLIFFGKSITDKPDRSPEFQAECVAKGLRKLGVERCTIVGLSYGGFVGFKMAEMYPDLVEAVVVSCSVMALTKSISDAGLARIGCSCWTDFLLPDTVEGARNIFETAAYKFPHFPDWIYKQFLEVMFDNRKEREEIVEAMVIPDEDFTVPNLQQRVCLLWGASDKIFDMHTARDVSRKLGNRATLDFIEKAGHIVQLERPFTYNRQLRKFLMSLSKEIQSV